MEWLKKLGKDIDYIEDNLDKEISYDEAARIACCSPYYFQRVFSYVSGVSLAEYCRATFYGSQKKHDLNKLFSINADY